MYYSQEKEMKEKLFWFRNYALASMGCVAAGFNIVVASYILIK